MEEIFKSSLEEIEKIIKQAEQLGMTNNQAFINWLDKLNEYSVLY